MNGQIVELAPFRLRAGTDEAALLRASAAFQAGFLEGRPGFVRRELVRAADGGYADLVWWSSMDVAATVMKDAMASPAAAAYFAVMEEVGDPASAVHHYRSLITYP